MASSITSSGSSRIGRTKVSTITARSSPCGTASRPPRRGDAAGTRETTTTCRRIGTGATIAFLIPLPRRGHRWGSSRPGARGPKADKTAISNQLSIAGCWNAGRPVTRLTVLNNSSADHIVKRVINPLIVVIALNVNIGSSRSKRVVRNQSVPQLRGD